MQLPQKTPKLWKLFALAALIALTIGLWLAVPAFYQSIDPSQFSPSDTTTKRLLVGGALVVAGSILAFLARLFGLMDDN